MGCWSESCALSGVEIGHGDACYVAAFTKEPGDRFNGQTFAVPPLKGFYDDYGGLEKMEGSAIWGIEPGGELDRDAIYELGQPIYIAASVFDRMGELVPDWCYDGINTLADANARLAEKLRTYAQKLKSIEPDQGDIDTYGEELARTVARSRRFFGTRLRDECFRSYPSMMKNDAQQFADLVDSNGDVEDFIKHYLRAAMLKRLESELRHRLVSGVSGPQHGGDEALIQLCKIRIEILEAKIRARKLDNGEICKTCFTPIAEDAPWHDGDCDTCHTKKEDKLC